MNGPEILTAILAGMERHEVNASYVYMLWNEGMPVYVGSTFVSVVSRIAGHRLDKSKTFTHASWIKCAGGIEASNLETELIQRLRPKYNKQSNPDWYGRAA